MPEFRQPKLRSGFFKQPSVLYARSLHRELGPYALVPGLTTADYLFLSALLQDSRIPTSELTEPVAIIDIGGVSAGNHTFAQKSAIDRSEEHTSELQSLMRISYAVFCLKIKTMNNQQHNKDATQQQN